MLRLAVAALLACLFIAQAAAAESQAKLTSAAPAHLTGPLRIDDVHLVHFEDRGEALRLSASNATLVVQRTRSGIGEAPEEETSWLAAGSILTLGPQTLASIDLGSPVEAGQLVVDEPDAPRGRAGPFLVGPRPVLGHTESLRSSASLPSELVSGPDTILVPSGTLRFEGSFSMHVYEGNVSIASPGVPMRTLRAGTWADVGARVYPVNPRGSPVVVQNQVSQAIFLSVKAGSLEASPPTLDVVEAAWRPGHVPTADPTASLRQNLATLGWPHTFLSLEAQSLRLQGHGLLHAVEGVLTQSGQRTQLGGQSLRLEGVFDARPSASVNDYPRLEWEVSGDTIKAQVVSPTRPVGAAIDGAVLVVASLPFLLVVPQVRRALRLLALALYARDDRPVQEHPVRRFIVDAVRAQPGINMRNLWKHVGVSWTTFRFHVYRLQRARVLSSVTEAGQRYLFVPGSLNSSQWNLVGLLNRRAVRPIGAMLDGPRPMTVSELAEALDLATSTVWVQLQRLLEAGLVEARREGKMVYYQATGLMRALRSGDAVVSGAEGPRTRAGGLGGDVAA